MENTCDRRKGLKPGAARNQSLLPGTGALFLAVAALLTVFSGCAREGSADPLLPENYDEWKKTTDEVLDYPIPGHEDHYRIIYINSIGESPAVTRDGSTVNRIYPDGTIVIKEIYAGREYSGGDEPSMLMGMVKAREHPDAREGWLWVVKERDTERERVFTDRFCVSCHGNANEEHPYGDKNPQKEFRDYLFFPYTE